MLQKTRNSIIGIVSFLLVVLVLQTIFVKSMKIPYFTYQNYKEQQLIFNSCYGRTLQDKKQELQGFINKVNATLDSKDIKQNSLEFLNKTNCRVSFVSQNDEQIRSMAKEVVMYINQFYENREIKLLNTVYTIDEQFSAILQQPRSYVFYALSEDETEMFGFIVTPKEDNTNLIKELWDKNQSKDRGVVQNMVAKILLLFNQKIF